jgi:hypothetical protein
MEQLVNEQPSAKPVAGANRRWRCTFRYRGSRREPVLAQLPTLGGTTRNETKNINENTIIILAVTAVPARGQNL